MDNKVFGHMVLELLKSSAIQGSALDAAVAVRDTAMALANGIAVVSFLPPAVEDEPEPIVEGGPQK